MTARLRIVGLVGVFLAAGLFYGCSNMAGEDKEGGGRKVDYAAREQNAPAETKARLATLREKIRSENLGFEIGYTKAMDRPLERLAGARVPADFAQRAKRENTVGRKLYEIDQRTLLDAIRQHPDWKLPSKCVADLGAWDFRSVNGVTSVRDQGGCGSCWDFAAVGAMEASELAVNKRTLDLSEQQVLDCSGGGTCGGGWHDGVFNWMVSHGTGLETVAPYMGTESTCNPNMSSPYAASSWGYVTTDMLPGFGWARIGTVAEIKEALCAHGPLASGVLATGLFQAYTSGVFKETLPDATLHPVDAPSGLKIYGINHDVLIIGWNDAKHAWLIKNSWGTGWGNNGDRASATDGYVWIDYDTNNIGFGAAWVHAKNKRYQLPREWWEVVKELPPIPDPGPLHQPGGNVQ
jgi:hypothetical protein